VAALTGLCKPAQAGLCLVEDNVAPPAVPTRQQPAQLGLALLQDKVQLGSVNKTLDWLPERLNAVLLHLPGLHALSSSWRWHDRL
jgi:hypothetical protein